MKKINCIYMFFIACGTSTFLVACNQSKTNENMLSSVEVIDNNSSKQWTETLKNTGYLVTDLDGDKIEDSICMKCIEKEGESIITQFDVIYGGDAICNLCEAQNVYRAEFERLETFDFNDDGKAELILQFDGHGSGGKGYHEIIVLWPQKDNIVEKSVVISDVKQKEKIDNMNIDSINDFEIVLYNGKKYLQTHQYLWSVDGSHSECEGDLISIVTLAKGETLFNAVESYISK